MRTLRLFTFGFLFLFLQTSSLTVAIAQQKTEEHQYAASSSTSTAAMTLIENSIDGWINNGGASAIIAAHGTTPERYQDTSYFCSAALEAAVILKDIDPGRATRYTALGTQIANWLIAHDDDNQDGLPGWGLPNAFDAFGDGTVNPPNQEYAIQDGPATDCLLEAYQATNTSKYLDLAKTVLMNYVNYWHAYTTNVDPLCQNCGFNYYSTNPNDAGHFVKNTIGMFAKSFGKLAEITHDPQAILITQQMVNGLIYDANVRHNFNYLAYDDPYSATRHTVDYEEAYTIHGLAAAVSSLGERNDPDYLTAIAAYRANFDSCGVTCYRGSNIGFTLCAIAPDDAVAKNECEQYILSHTTSEWGEYDIMGIIEGLSAL